MSIYKNPAELKKQTFFKWYYFRPYKSFFAAVMNHGILLPCIMGSEISSLALWDLLPCIMGYENPMNHRILLPCTARPGFHGRLHLDDCRAPAVLISSVFFSNLAFVTMLYGIKHKQ
jgi:hypothetical protein